MTLSDALRDNVKFTFILLLLLFIEEKFIVYFHNTEIQTNNI